jgi:hypothetical protein
MMQEGSSSHFRGSEVIGKLVFYATLVAVVLFFWWLLIYDHGVTTAH